MSRHALQSALGPVMVALALVGGVGARAQELPLVTGVEAQPLIVQINRLVEALDYLGRPLPPQTRRQLEAVLAMEDPDEVARRAQRLLDPHCLVGVTINPESRVKADPGPAARVLDENGWQQFFVKVYNEAGVTAPLRVSSPQAQPLHGAPAGEVRDRWLDAQMFDSRPMAARLSGLEVEYRIIQLYSRDAGKRSAVMSFDVGQGTQDLGFRSDVLLTFDCRPAQTLTFRVQDVDGEPTTASFTIRDALGRVYPSQAKRLAPDFAFHPQVYRADGEHVKLPAGRYTIDYTRGPEYVPQQATVTVKDQPVELAVKLRRWIDPAGDGWWSGDHHIHAAGCKHYEDPTQGVHAADMIRHVLGEDLKVGANLTWGPCFDYQKQFFTGAVDPVSQYPYLLRYDIEVSGFGSHRSGHLCLLRLRDQMYPGGDSKDHWPTLGLNTIRWAKKQGAVVGPAHSGWGLEVLTSELPHYQIPPFDGIGANEYIMNVTHEVPGPEGKPVPAVDFISTVDTIPQWELNIWYHTLNCGFRTRISGETDFPCIYGERVGLGRSYVKLDGKLDYDDWCEGIRQGRAYVSDGFSHLMDLRVNGQEMGVNGSELRLPSSGTVKVTAKVAARLDEEIDPALGSQGQPSRRFGRPYWHLEKARLGESRRVPVEVIVNGYPVARQEIVADGSEQAVSFDVPIERSSWVAMRIYPSSHTNPVFVLVNGRPIRASKRSAQWCLDSLEQCWKQKQQFYAESEMQQAKADYDHARKVYRRIIGESSGE